MLNMIDKKYLLMGFRKRNNKPILKYYCMLLIEKVTNETAIKDRLCKFFFSFLYPLTQDMRQPDRIMLLIYIPFITYKV